MKFALASVAAATLLQATYGLTEFVKQNVRENFGDHRFIALPISEVGSRLFDLLENFGVDDLGYSNDEAHFRLSPAAVEVLELEGYTFADRTEEFLAENERNLNLPGFMCEEEPEVCARKSLEDFHSSYQSYDSIHARFDELARTNARMSSIETVGTSYEGHLQKVLWIGDQSLPLVLYICTTHSREWITPMYCTYMAETLLDSSNAESQRLLDTYSFAIIPIVNPDGFIYSQEVDNYWRKTRKPNQGSRCAGADPNRNYGTGWGGKGSSGNPCSDTYRGKEAFDQDCIANIKAFTDKHQDRLIHINDVHSYGEYWLSPLSAVKDLPPDVEAHKVVNKAVYDAIFETSGLRFKVGPGATTIYEAAGASVDYFYVANKVIHSYVYEARGGGRIGLGGFQPPTSNIMPSNIELFAGMVAALDAIKVLELDENVSENEVPTGEPEESSFQGGAAIAVAWGSLVAILAAVAFVAYKYNKKEKDDDGETVIPL